MDYRQLLIKFMASAYDRDGFYDFTDTAEERYGVTQEDITALKELEDEMWALVNKDN